MQLTFALFLTTTAHVLAWIYQAKMSYAFIGFAIINFCGCMLIMFRVGLRTIRIVWVHALGFLVLSLIFWLVHQHLNIDEWLIYWFWALAVGTWSWYLVKLFAECELIVSYLLGSLAWCLVLLHASQILTLSVIILYTVVLTYWQIFLVYRVERQTWRIIAVTIISVLAMAVGFYLFTWFFRIESKGIYIIWIFILNFWLSKSLELVTGEK